ncbi:MAG: polysaccharide pyruvyl transferase family protein, partial [Clostridium sp.]|nr:polysaccharide pyruvyl transferase family protein [Clostridium sp.]
MGYEVLMLEKPNEPPFPPVSTPRLFITTPYPAYALSKLYKSLTEMVELNDRCNTFIVPSDQLWNYCLFGHAQEFYLLSFVKSCKRKISYATSFGTDLYDGDEKARRRMDFYLRRFQAISVREQSGKAILKHTFGREAAVVLDPVFLCNTKEYYRLIENSNANISGAYIFCYILWPDEMKKEFLKTLSKLLNIKIICIGNALDKNKYIDWDIDFVNEANVEDWLFYIKNASIVVADSFHATCFSVIFNKQFIALSSQKHTRISSLLNILGLEEHYFCKNVSANISNEVSKLVN